MSNNEASSGTSALNDGLGVSHAELLRLHEILMAPGACEPTNQGDTLTVRLLKDYIIHNRMATAQLHEAVRRLREWSGIAGPKYSATIALDVMDWIDGGMVGDLPALPDYATPNLNSPTPTVG
jgi:hypothetical protein